jgi:hypothetical protein
MFEVKNQPLLVEVLSFSVVFSTSVVNTYFAITVTHNLRYNQSSYKFRLYFKPLSGIMSSGAISKKRNCKLGNDISFLCKKES